MDKREEKYWCNGRRDREAAMNRNRLFKGKIIFAEKPQPCHLSLASLVLQGWIQGTQPTAHLSTVHDLWYLCKVM